MVMILQGIEDLKQCLMHHQALLVIVMVKSYSPLHKALACSDSFKMETSFAVMPP